MPHTTKYVSNHLYCDSEHSQHPKMWNGRGDYAKSYLSGDQKYPKAIKTSDGRGRVCKRCSKCGERAKSNRAASCVNGCVDPFPKKAPGTTRKRKIAVTANKVKKRKLENNNSDFREAPALLTFIGPEMSSLADVSLEKIELELAPEEIDFDFFEKFTMVPSELTPEKAIEALFAEFVYTEHQK